MKNRKFNVVTFFAVLCTLMVVVLQSCDVPIPQQAYGVTGGLGLAGLRLGDVSKSEGTKYWFESKTLWTALIMLAVSTFAAFDIYVPDYLFAFITAMGVIFYSTAKENITP